MNPLTSVQYVPQQVGIMSDLMQYGFAGFAIVLLGIIIWQIRDRASWHKELIEILRLNHEVITKNTEAVNELTRQASRTENATRELHEAMLQKPCLVES